MKAYGINIKFFFKKGANKAIEERRIFFAAQNVTLHQGNTIKQQTNNILLSVKDTLKLTRELGRLLFLWETATNLFCQKVTT